ncbi:hypothetical protein CFD26_100945 [Aspergillus turcosus]|uniref:Uncharacterized protein n=1 Tax=Aspergillus turcosus TaxID=1245748 RepID=A0A3R7HPD4_9EURO|nr:hypothetical protein CFD26_100945 [Aspergillus turcosus]
MAPQLHLFLVRALAEHVLGGLKGPTWIHSAPDDLIQGIAVFQTTSDMARSSDVNSIHPYATEQDLQDIRPKALQSFVNLARPQHGTLSALIRASLPASAIVNILPRFDRQSETDLHEMLAEAIVCGRPGSDQTAEPITGVRTVFQGERPATAAGRLQPRASRGVRQRQGPARRGRGPCLVSSA